MGLRAGVDRYGKSHFHRDSIPGPVEQLCCCKIYILNRKEPLDFSNEVTIPPEWQFRIYIVTLKYHLQHLKSRGLKLNKFIRRREYEMT